VPQDLIVGLDIGTTKICAVVGEVRDNQVDIVGLGQAPTAGGLRKGVVVNIENTVRAIRKAVEEAETMAGCEIRSVYAGVGGGQTKVINSQGIIAIKDREVTPADMERVIDTARTVAIPSDREVIHTLVQDFLIDGQDGIKDPVGIHGVRLECKVHIVTGAIPTLNNIMKCANRAGLEVSGIALQTLAAGEAVLTEEEKELGVALIDFGGGTTDLALFAENALRYNFVLPVGGNNLTNDIAVGLPTSLNHAEELKKHYGCCLNALADPNEVLEVPGLTGRETQQISRNRLAEIMHLRVAEIINLLGKEIQRFRFTHPLHSGAVLVGGTSLVDGLPELAGDVFGMHTRIGYPMGVSGLIDVIHDPSYATGVGLVLYGFRSQQKAQRGQPESRWAGASRWPSRPSGGGLLNRLKKWFREVV
jgi:cell division protein FtsA